MKVLVRVVRNPFQPEVVFPETRMRRWPHVILPMFEDLRPDRTDFTRQGEFFLVEEGPDAEATLRALAEANPGHEVQVWNLTQSAQCPAGPVVMKKVSEAGVLPV